MDSSDILQSPFTPFSRANYAQQTYPNSSFRHNGMTGSQFPNPPRTAGLKFRRRTESINWRLLAGVDIDRVTEETDFGCLQQNLLHVTFCNIDSEVDWRYGVDQNLVKLFKLSQLISEYLLHSQEYLTETINFLEIKNRKLQQLNSTLSSKSEKQDTEIVEMKKESKKKKQLIKELQAKVAAGAQQYFPCTMCEKSFMSDYFLQQHIQRRHPDALPGGVKGGVDETSGKVEEMEKEMADLKQRLQSTELSLERAKNESYLRDQIELLKTTTLGNISEGQIPRNIVNPVGQVAEQPNAIQEQILQQLNDLQLKHEEAKGSDSDRTANTKELTLYQEKLRKLEVENESQRLLLERLQNSTRVEVVENELDGTRRRTTAKGKQPNKQRSLPKQSTPKTPKQIQKGSEKVLDRNMEEDQVTDLQAVSVDKDRMVLTSAVEGFDQADFADEVEPFGSSSVQVCPVIECEHNNDNNDQFHYAKATLNAPTTTVKSRPSAQKTQNPKSSRLSSPDQNGADLRYPNGSLKVTKDHQTGCKTEKDSQRMSELVDWYRSTHRPRLASHDQKVVYSGQLRASVASGRKRKRVNFNEQSGGDEEQRHEDEEDEESSEEVEIPATFSQSERLRRALENDPELLAKLRPEMEQILATELKKLGIPEDSTGISGKTLNSKMRLLSDARAETNRKRDLSQLRQEYSTDIDLIAREKLKNHAKFQSSFLGRTAEPNLSAELGTLDSSSRKTPPAKRVLFSNKNKPSVKKRSGSVDRLNKSPVASKRTQSFPSADQQRQAKSETGPQIGSNGDVKKINADDIEDFSFDDSELDFIPSAKPSAQPVTLAGVNASQTMSSNAAVPSKVNGGGMTSGGDAGSAGAAGSDNSSVGSLKLRPQTNGLVNGNAKAGVVSMSTMLDSEDDEDSDWDKDIEMADMMPGPKPKPRSVAAPVASPNQNSSFNSTNGVQAAAKNLEAKLMSRPDSAAKMAGAVDVFGGGSNPGRAKSGNVKQSGFTSAAHLGDSESEPFSDDDDFSKNGSSHGVPAASSGHKSNFGLPVMSSTLMTDKKGPNGSTAGNNHRTPTASNGKTTVGSSVTATNKESIVSVTSFDSETLSDFDL
ncbi:uncharacterized protein LOC142341640 isoform X3 [Convolutriloba macropyga]|uniref:uncharacterized protein LOC142341640 isoform X3 n=1 Tax=Convolutriloba macropyga TaxID=536237 RepID=UPI003F51F9E6